MVIFSGNYQKSCFAFERKFAKSGSLTSQTPQAPLTFAEPQIPPEMEQRTSGFTSTMRNIYDRLTGNERLPRLPQMEESFVETCNLQQTATVSTAVDDIFIRGIQKLR